MPVRRCSASLFEREYLIFIKDYCPVAEFGLVGQTMHKADERVAVRDIENLTDIYEAVLRGYFK